MCLKRLFLISNSNQSTYSKESTSIFVAVINSNLASVNSNIATDTEVRRQERSLRAVHLEDHLAVKESTLEGSTVGLTGLSNHNGLVFQEIEDDHSANSVVLEAAFNDTLLEVAIKTKDLYNK